MAEESLKDKTMKEIMQYAPVCIPTLNRYEHFKRCLESLENCYGADKTDVYIGLDYPPSEKYIEGWKQINDYLKEKEKKNGFKCLIVIKREKNYGISKIGESNFGRLIYDYIIDKYDKFISSEDDNVFSPNFLEFVNLGLERYKDDKNCVAICGYNYEGLTFSDYDYNIYLSREYSAWGIGNWTEKWVKQYDYLTIEYAKNIMSSWKKIWAIYKHEPRLLNTVMLNIAINRPFGDTMRVCYQYLEGKYSVFPVLSKVKNMGFDGSGTSIFKTDDTHAKQIIDESTRFEMDDIKSGVNDDVQKQVESVFKKSLPMDIIIFIRVFLYWLLKIDVLYYEQKRRNKSLFKN